MQGMPDCHTEYDPDCHSIFVRFKIMTTLPCYYQEVNPRQRVVKDSSRPQTGVHARHLRPQGSGGSLRNMLKLCARRRYRLRRAVKRARQPTAASESSLPPDLRCTPSSSSSDASEAACVLNMGSSCQS